MTVSELIDILKIIKETAGEDIPIYVFNSYAYLTNNERQPVWKIEGVTVSLHEQESIQLNGKGSPHTFVGVC